MRIHEHNLNNKIKIKIQTLIMQMELEYCNKWEKTINKIKITNKSFSIPQIKIHFYRTIMIKTK